MAGVVWRDVVRSGDARKARQARHGTDWFGRYGESRKAGMSALGEVRSDRERQARRFRTRQERPVATTSVAAGLGSAEQAWKASKVSAGSVRAWSR